LDLGRVRAALPGGAKYQRFRGMMTEEIQARRRQLGHPRSVRLANYLPCLDGAKDYDANGVACGHVSRRVTSLREFTSRINEYHRATSVAPMRVVLHGVPSASPRAILFCWRNRRKTLPHRLGADSCRA
jgi:hypothetical protein